MQLGRCQAPLHRVLADSKQPVLGARLRGRLRCSVEDGRHRLEERGPE